MNVNKWKILNVLTQSIAVVARRTVETFFFRRYTSGIEERPVGARRGVKGRKATVVTLYADETVGRSRALLAVIARRARTADLYDACKEKSQVKWSGSFFENYLFYFSFLPLPLPLPCFLYFPICCLSLSPYMYFSSFSNVYLSTSLSEQFV